MNIIGISGLHNSVEFKRRLLPNLSKRDFRIAQGFDSAAALVTSSGIKAAAAEERFNKEKGSGAFPVNAIRYCLETGNVAPEAIDYIAHGFSYEPFDRFYDDDAFLRGKFREVYSREVQNSLPPGTFSEPRPVPQVRTGHAPSRSRRKRVLSERNSKNHSY